MGKKLKKGENIKSISVITPCFNEEENVETVYREVKEVFDGLKGYSYEHVFIDNASNDNTFAVLKRLASKDFRVKVIVNTRNFGHIRSPYHAMLQVQGDAVIGLAADLQDPPGLIKDFIEKWKQGYKIVVGVKKSTGESRVKFFLRNTYYDLLSRLSSIDLVKNNTGFGLYDREVIEELRKIDDRYPYFRGLTAELGYQSAKIDYVQPQRKRGKSSNNFYDLYDMALLGITSHSKVPLRMATFLGFSSSAISLLVAVIYFGYKLIYWQSFSVGIAPIVIGLFLFFSIQLFFLGILGEYLGVIHTQVLNRPLVVERERLNFDKIGTEDQADIGKSRQT